MLYTWRAAFLLPSTLTKAVARSFTWPSCGLEHAACQRHGHAWHAHTLGDGPRQAQPRHDTGLVAQGGDGSPANCPNPWRCTLESHVEQTIPMRVIPNASAAHLRDLLPAAGNGHGPPRRQAVEEPLLRGGWPEGRRRRAVLLHGRTRQALSK
jgi:hypothetical protein